MKTKYTTPHLETIIIDSQCPLLRLSGGSVQDSINIRQEGDTNASDNRVKANNIFWDDTWN